MSIYEKIQAGEYDDGPKPRKPDKPLILNQLHNLPAAAWDEARKIRQEYDNALALHSDAVVEWEKKSVLKMEQFRRDLLAEHDVNDGAFARKMLAIAWDYGHSAGLGDVAGYFADLVPLYQIYKSDVDALAKALGQ